MKPGLVSNIVAPKMIETDAMIGGEESGGYAFRGNVPERDGILAGLYFLDLMVKLNKKPSELLQMLFEKVGAHYYDRIDTAFSGDRAAREQKILERKPADDRRVEGRPAWTPRMDISSTWEMAAGCSSASRAPSQSCACIPRPPTRTKCRPSCKTACGLRDWRNRGLADRYPLPPEP